MLSFEEAIEKLQETSDKLKSGETTLEESAKLYEESVKYYELCSKILAEAKQKIEIYRPDGKTEESEEIPAGRYTVVETKAPEGYVKNAEPVSFTVTAAETVFPFSSQAKRYTGIFPSLSPEYSSGAPVRERAVSIASSLVTISPPSPCGTAFSVLSEKGPS